MGPDLIDVGTLAYCLDLEPHSWWVVLVEDISAGYKVTHELAERLAIELDEPVRELQARTARDILVAATSTGDGTLCLHILEDFGESDWQTLDLNRSRLLRVKRGIFVMTEAALPLLERGAPNLASFFGSRVQHWDNIAERMLEQRLSALRTEYKMTDDEVVVLAQAKQQPAEPDFVEWLQLMGRGDLIG